MRKAKMFLSVILIASILNGLLLYGSVFVSAQTTDEYLSKCENSLIKVMDKANDNEKIAVSIWIKDINTTSIDKIIENSVQEKLEEKGRKYKLNNEVGSVVCMDNIAQLDSVQIDELVMLERNEKSKLYKKTNNNFINKYLNDDRAEILYVSQYAPNIEATLTKSEIQNILQIEDVTNVFISVNNEEFINDCEKDSIASVSNVQDNEWYFETTGVKQLRDTYNLDGTGVKVGVIEYNVPNLDAPCFANVDYISRPYDISNRLDTLGGHVSTVFSILAASTDNYTGGIPNAQFYCTSVYNPAGYVKSAFEWVISQGVSVITCSAAFGADYFSEYGDTSKWIDHIMNQHNVVYIMAGPNDNNQGVGSGGMGYNTILVGKYGMDGSVNTGYLTESAEPYKPDLLAPGGNITTPFGECGGTSFAAPIVACAATQLIQKYPNLRLFPMLNKCVLLNGASYLGEENPLSLSPYSFNAFSRNSGAGVLNVLKSSSVLTTGNDYSIDSITNNSVTHTFYVSSADVSNGRKLKVTQCSIKENTASDTHTTDSVLTNGIVNGYKVDVVRQTTNEKWYSYSYYDNKVEVYFTPPAKGYYDITVTRLTASSTKPNQSCIAFAMHS